MFRSGRTTIGRERELAELRERVVPGGLVTLVGPPGVGKSHLARAFAASWEGGIVRVELEEQRAADVAGPVLDTIGRLAPAAMATDDRLAWLATQPYLLLIDAAEVALDAIADLLRRVHHPTSLLAVLCTSTATLSIEHEDVVRVQPLAVPAGDIAAADVRAWPGVTLFVELARASGVAVTSTPDRLRTVLRLCRTLDGIPLALELAAGRLRHLPLDELDRRMDQRFRWLRSPTSAGGRHDGLAVALSASHELLDSQQRRALRWLSVFEGGFELSDAVALVGDRAFPDRGPDDPDGDADTVLELVDRSFVVLEDDRYRLLQTVRAYARQRLTEAAEEDLARRRHLDWALRIIATAPSVSTLRRRHADLAAAFDHAVAIEDSASALSIAPCLWVVWERAGRVGDGLRRLRAAIAAAPADCPGRSAAVAAAADLAIAGGRLDEAAELAAESLKACALDCDVAGEARAWNTLGLVDLYRGRHDDAQAHCGEAATRFRSIDDPRGVGHALTVIGLVARARGHLVEAAAIFEDAYECLLAAGVRGDAADVLHNLADTLIDSRQTERARSAAQRALALRRELGDERGIGLSLGLLSRVESMRGEQRAADILGDEAVDSLRRAGDLSALGALLNNLANRSRATGDHQRARAWYDEARRTYLELGDHAAAALVEANTAVTRTTPSASAEPLSARELEVLHLLAEGLHNRGVADRLFISIRTVDAHLTHIRTKLGIASRGGLIRWAIEHAETGSPSSAPI